MRKNKVDPSIALVSFFLKCVGFWLYSTKRGRILRQATFVYTIVAILFAAYVEGLDFYYSWGNFSDLAYLGCNLTQLAMILFKLLTAFFYRHSFMNLIRYTQKHFWFGEYDLDGYKFFRRANWKCMLSVGTATVLAQSTIACYILTPIIENIGRNISDRVLPFNFRIDFPFSESPYYEITFAIQIMSLYHAGVCYFCFDNFLYIINIHLACQFKILQNNLLKICDWRNYAKKDFEEKEDEEDCLKITAKIYDRMKNCIRKHQNLIKYSDEVEKIFNLLIMGQVLLLSIVICLVGFQAFLADGPTARRAIFIVHIIGTIPQLYAFTSTCNDVMQTSNDIAMAAFFSGWYNLPMNKAGRILRKDISMIIMRARRPCVLTAAKFFPVSLATYTKVVSTAMSYFTLMRQGIMKIDGDNKRLFKEKENEKKIDILRFCILFIELLPTEATVFHVDFFQNSLDLLTWTYQALLLTEKCMNNWLLYCLWPQSAIVGKCIKACVAYQNPTDMRPDITKDLSINVMSFLMKIVGFWLAADSSEKLRRDLALYYTISATLFAVSIECLDFYYTWGNFSDTTYVACNMVTLIMVLFKILIISIHREDLTNIILYTLNNFWICDYDNHNYNIWAQCKRKCVVFVCWSSFFVQATVCCYIINPLIENIGRNESSRVLPFSMWINFPFSLSPYYEITFITQVLSLIHVGVCFFCFDNVFCILNVHLAGQFKMLYRRFLTICDSLSDTKFEINKGDLDSTEIIYQNFRGYIRKHQALINFCEKMESIFSLIILGQVVMFSFLICLVGYQILLASGPLARRALFIAHITGNFYQFLFFTRSCHNIIETSGQIGDAAYSALWYKLPMSTMGRKFRRDLIIVIMRSRRPCCLTAGGFFPVCLETYCTMLSTALSYFALLRQHSLKVSA
ncbi:uncharacterized protein [Prorops nasuta]|uniref:uncharacterized protein n=1 Tax=Prorops nasuta TaxID=863751 RepID=UPI0034CFB90A